ncbi:hypothetical protein BCV72DRAFT_242418 [Rhizopus microsporus var. microsporus]|uniref:Uncharacterized protein n=1 Tax=Rhizopus microsporus var. microsporus TaxID=86635 RepID=A0A1X0R1S9_RHIZD|nr:hypothetical protein BCV72DRAFT_242418 [Rhizopus microsporus var. microsporus]
MKKNSSSEEEVSAIVKTIVEQCSKVKTYVSSGKVNDLPKDLLPSQDVDMIHDMFSSYPPNHQFAKGSIYYDCKPFGQRNSMGFCSQCRSKGNEATGGMLFTDGVADDTKKGGSGAGRRTKAVDEEDFKYIEKLEKEEPLAGVGKCVLIDPGRRGVLYCMHEESTIENKRTYRYTSNQRAIETKSRKFKKLRESLLKCKSSTVNGDKFAKYLQERATVTPVLNIRLTRYMITKFGDDVTLIIGNWSAGNVKFHEPIRDAGIRRMLAKQGFKLYLLDKFKTSSLCPTCLNGELEKLKNVQNSRSFQREKQLTVTCHGLLRCKIQQCLETTTGAISRCCLWNRDMVATLNFRHILFGLRKNGKRLERFCRLNASPSTGFKRKATSSASSRPTKKIINPLKLPLH